MSNSCITCFGVFSLCSGRQHKHNILGEQCEVRVTVSENGNGQPQTRRAPSRYA